MRIVTIWRALIGIGRRLQLDPLRMMDLGRCLPGTGEGASLLTRPFHLYDRTNRRGLSWEAPGSEIGSSYNSFAYFMTVLVSLASSPRHANGPIDKRAAKDAMLPRYPAEKSGLR